MFSLINWILIFLIGKSIDLVTAFNNRKWIHMLPSSLEIYTTGYSMSTSLSSLKPKSLALQFVYPLWFSDIWYLINIWYFLFVSSDKWILFFPTLAIWILLENTEVCLYKIIFLTFFEMANVFSSVVFICGSIYLVLD